MTSTALPRPPLGQLCWLLDFLLVSTMVNYGEFGDRLFVVGHGCCAAWAFKLWLLIICTWLWVLCSLGIQTLIIIYTLPWVLCSLSFQTHLLCQVLVQLPVEEPEHELAGSMQQGSENHLQ